MTNPPNLFNFATGELSQDAFLCWLSEWGNADLSSVDKSLNRVSREFLAMLCQHQFSPDDIKTVEARCQYLKTDVLIDIELRDSAEKHLILIEDKTTTSHHSNQLNRYKDSIEEDLKTGRYSSASRKLHLIYYKTTDHITRELFGFKNIERRDVLPIFETSHAKKVKNQIFVDYASRLRRMEDDSLAYKTIPHQKWEYSQWSGFFKAFCETLGGDANFGYVPNRSGGFIGAWFGGVKCAGLNDGEGLYFQINAFPKPQNSSEEENSRCELTLRVASPEKAQTISLKNTVLPVLEKLFNEANIEIDTKNIQPGRSMRILSILEQGIGDGPNKAENYATKLLHIIKIVKRIQID